MKLSKKKKERTPQQIRQRFYFAVALLGFMFLYVLADGIRMKHRNGPGSGADSLAVFDRQLDSVVRKEFGEGAAVIGKGYPENVSDRDQYRRDLEQARQLADLSAQWGGDAYDEYSGRLDQLQKREARQSNNEKTLQRTVTIRLDDGSLVYAIQSADRKLRRSVLKSRIHSAPELTVADSIETEIQKETNK